MNPKPDERDRDPLSAYADGDPDAVRDAAPRAPSEAEWEVVRRRIHARVDSAREQVAPFPRPRSALWLVTGAALTAAAAALGWVVFNLALPKDPQAPDVANVQPSPQIPVAPPPREAAPDPLAAFDVLPMATEADVVLHRVPGDGGFPVGAHPLPGAIALATSEEVELDDVNATWPGASPAPGAFPMIFAARPR